MKNLIELQSEKKSENKRIRQTKIWTQNAREIQYHLFQKAMYSMNTQNMNKSKRKNTSTWEWSETKKMF